jgi:hypothetical protein
MMAKKQLGSQQHSAVVAQVGNVDIVVLVDSLHCELSNNDLLELLL